MCCFSGPVRHVAGTHLFARLTTNRTQFLAYQMVYQADRPVAMILPLPVAARGQDAVRFLSLKNYPGFFADLEKCFVPPPPARSVRTDGVAPSAGGIAPPPLPVYAVGDFVASFVPSLDDFGRLDKRFVLPRKTWDQIPAYRDYGFAVFQLGEARVGKQVHPMALAFTTRLPGVLFFPTVHIHDSHVHAREDFDHALYFQTRRTVPGALPDESRHVAGRFVNVGKTQGMVWGGDKLFKRELRGSLLNRDTLIRLA